MAKETLEAQILKIKAAKGLPKSMSRKFLLLMA